jgi:hypothetical protein
MDLVHVWSVTLESQHGAPIGQTIYVVTKSDAISEAARVTKEYLKKELPGTFIRDMSRMTGSGRYILISPEAKDSIIYKEETQ